MKEGYFVWGMKLVPDACVLDELIEVENKWNLVKGVSRVSDFPQKAAFCMNPDFPNNTIMTDSLRNIRRLIVGSARLAQFLQARGLEAVEYLPVAVVNHKKKVVSRDYFIIHPVNPVDCLDIAKSGARFSKIDKTTADEVKKLVLDEKRIPSTRELFRPKPFYDVVLASRELAEAIVAQGFTGIRWTELDNYS